VTSLHYGQIVLASVSDGHGNTKNRPVVIVTPTGEIAEDRDFLAVCISTQIEDPTPLEHVKLPWSRPRHPRTGLNRPNVAKCEWIVALPFSSIVKVLGSTPSAQMAEIALILLRLRSGDKDQGGAS
jgi:mRNA-degrading endonuclease toxin of MazEF toxin-antitoxin module